MLISIYGEQFLSLVMALTHMKEGSSWTSAVGKVTALAKRSLHLHKQRKTNAEEKKKKDAFWQGLLAQLDFGSGGSKSLNYIKIDLRKNQ